MTDGSSTPNLHRLAINAALNCDWNEALRINQEIIKLEPENTECLNRLAKSYFELGDYNHSQKAYQEVLELDPYNTIAQKNLKKIASCRTNGKTNHNGGITSLSPTSFLSEPGITKSVTLIKVAEPQKLLTLSAGMGVSLVPKARGISVTDIGGQYLGVLPDDTAFHLIKLIKGGNKYQAFIQAVKQNSITLLIREVFRSKKFKNQASFLDEGRIMTYSSDHITFLTDDDEAPTDSQVESEDLPI